MLLGPVFRAELIRTARRRHYYLLRVGYGLVLLLLIWFNFQSLRRARRCGAACRASRISPNLHSATFIWFIGVQLATILILVPALFGGVIADEKQRKIMHYLMASRLSQR